MPYYRELEELDAQFLNIEDASALSDMRAPQVLVLAGNSISDVSPLADWTGLRRLDLNGNNVSDIGAPLTVRSLWQDRALLFLLGNPLNSTSRDEHVPQLESWGVRVYVESQASAETYIPDPVLRALIGQTIAGNQTLVVSTITEEGIAGLRTLRAFAAGVSDLTGLETAENLEYLFLGSNSVARLDALADLPNLVGIDISDNNVFDLAPLVENLDFAEGDWLSLSGNPLSEESLNEHLPRLARSGGRTSAWMPCELMQPMVSVASATKSGVFFAAVLGAELEITISVDDPALATAEIAGGILTVVPVGAGGVVTATVTATDANGQSVTLSFRFSFSATEHATLPVWLFPRASDMTRQGFCARRQLLGRAWRSDGQGNRRFRSPCSAGQDSHRGQTNGSIRIPLISRKAIQRRDSLSAWDAVRVTGGWRSRAISNRPSYLTFVQRTGS